MAWHGMAAGPTLQVSGPGQCAAACVRHADERVGNFGGQHVQQERPQAAGRSVVGCSKAQATTEVIRLRCNASASSLAVLASFDACLQRHA
jgi:hypothetical protein